MNHKFKMRQRVTALCMAAMMCCGMLPYGALAEDSADVYKRQGYEKADLPDNFFDLAIGNVPFGQYQVSDRRYDKLHFQIHDYFLAKTVDKLRVGGIMAFITTSGTLDRCV